MSSNETTMPWKMVVLVVILVSSVVGNILVIIVVHRSRRDQWTTNHFVLNLAVVNLLTPALYLSVTLDSLYRGHWVLGGVGCKLWAFLGHFNAFVSVGVMCCMSFDRFYLTAYPLTFKLSKIQTKKIILLIWLFAASICSPFVHFYNMDPHDSQNCLPESSREWTAFIFVFSLLFLVLHFATYMMYFKVYFCILARNSKSAGLNQRFASKVPRTKIKVTKLLVTQIAVHTLLWLPFILYQIISSLSTFVRDNLAANTATLYIVYTSSACSPIIYAVFSGDFRRGCKQILMKYDASNAYRIPAQLERKHRVDFIISDQVDLNRSGPSCGRLSLSVKRESTEQEYGMTFEQHRQAWS